MAVLFPLSSLNMVDILNFMEPINGLAPLKTQQFCCIEDDMLASSTKLLLF